MEFAIAYILGMLLSIPIIILIDSKRKEFWDDDDNR